jgi:DNA-binding GntR family transcriptional regulator
MPPGQRPASRRAAKSKVSSSTALYEQLAERIMKGELPEGARMTENELAEEFGVSRTPVREALKLLNHTGLVTKLPTRGYAARALDLAATDQLYTVRAALEELAVELAAKSVGTPAFETFKRDIAGFDPSQQGKTDSFHERLAVLADNDYLCRCLGEIYARTAAYRRLDNALQGRAEAADHDHRRIVELLEAGDVGEARRIVREHIGRSQESLRALIAAGVSAVSVVTSPTPNGPDGTGALGQRNA